MGRPTTEKKEKTVKLRVSEELYGEIEKCGDNISESIRELIRAGLGIEKHGEIPEGNFVPQKEVNEWEAALKGRCKGDADEFFGRHMWNRITVLTNEEYEKITKSGEIVPQNIMKESTYRELEDMCIKSGFSTERFFDRVCEMFNDGNIYVDGLNIETKGKFDTSELEDMCHRMNTDPQDMIDKLTKSLMRG